MCNLLSQCRLRCLWFDDVDCVDCFDGVEVDVVVVVVLIFDAVQW